MSVKCPFITNLVPRKVEKENDIGKVWKSEERKAKNIRKICDLKHLMTIYAIFDHTNCTSVIKYLKIIIFNFYSSTSNDDPSKQHNIERYGQVNPGFVTSRPNSLYQQINNPGPQSITDYEASRPPSALTSYSNFHGQRRPNAVLPQQNKPLIGNQLTQESFNQFEEKKMNAR